MPNTIVKRWNPALNGGLGGFEELYPKTTVGQISASGTADSTTFLRGDGQWAVPVTKDDLKYLYIYGKAESAITKGQAVQFAGVQGDHILIKPAVPSDINTNPDYFIGLAEATLATNDFGYILTQGELVDVNTNAYTAGNVLWFASAGGTNGALTATEPTGTNAKIQVGAVTKVNASSGIILTRMHIIGTPVEDITASGTRSATTFLNGNGAWEIPATQSHTHGSITYTGTITSDTAVTSGQKLVLVNGSDAIVRSTLAIGTATNTFLRNDGTWSTPAGGGTVTSVTGTSPIASSGGNDPVISVASGFTIPTSTEKTNYDSAHTHSTTTTGSIHGSTTVGESLLRLTNPSAVTFLRVNVNNTITTRNAADFRTDIGAGTVTSVTGTAPIVSSGGNTPAISLAASYGDTQNPYASKTAKNFLAAPNAANGVPTFRAMVASDLPSIGNITNAGAIGSTATLPIITTTSGVLTTGSFGTTSGTFAQGNDARLSDARTPTSHATSATTYGAGTNTNYGHVKGLKLTPGSTDGESGVVIVNGTAYATKTLRVDNIAQQTFGTVLDLDGIDGSLVRFVDITLIRTEGTITYYVGSIMVDVSTLPDYDFNGTPATPTVTTGLRWRLNSRNSSNTQVTLPIFMWKDIQGSPDVNTLRIYVDQASTATYQFECVGYY